MIEISEIDFSQFHPLDHWPGSPYCRSLPGGFKNHMELYVDLKLAEDFRWIRWPLCLIGKHKFFVWYSTPKVELLERPKLVVRPTCSCCGKTREPTEEEIKAGYDMPFFDL